MTVFTDEKSAIFFAVSHARRVRLADHGRIRADHSSPTVEWG
jgi:hypothetical protein